MRDHEDAGQSSSKTTFHTSFDSLLFLLLILVQKKKCNFHTQFETATSRKHKTTLGKVGVNVL